MTRRRRDGHAGSAGLSDGGSLMRRLATLILVAVCFAALAPTVSAGRTRVGSDYLVNPGETITFDGTISGCNHLIAGVEIHQDGAISSIPLADNIGNGCVDLPIATLSVTNTTESDQLFRLFLTDATCDVTFDAGSNHAKV